MRKLLIGLLIGVLSLIGISQSDAIKRVVGANIDGTFSTAFCNSFGFSVEKSVTLGGSTVTRMVRVDRSSTTMTNTGYIITETGGGKTLTAFNLDTLGIIGTDAFPNTIYETGQRVAGDVFADGLLYFGINMLSGASNGGASCPVGSGFSCVSMNKYNSSVVKVAEVVDTSILAARRVSAIDDVRESGTTIMAVVGETTGVRDFRTYVTASLAFSTIGTTTTANVGRLSREFQGSNYGVLSLAGSTVWQFTAGNPTAAATSSVLYAPRLASAIYGGNNTLLGLGNLIYTESDTTGAGSTRGQYLISPFAANCASCPYITTVPNAAAYQGTFYDVANNKVFSTRSTDGVSDTEFVRTVSDFAVNYVPEEIFTCPGAVCGGPGGLSLGVQTVDYAPQKMRLYVGSNTNPVVLSKIKVCASGGP